MSGPHQKGRTGLLTPRGLALGLVMSILIGLAGPYWTFYLHSSTLFLDYSVPGAMFLLFVLVLIFNGLAGRLVQPVALRPGELAVVGAMMLSAGAVVTMGLVGYLIPNITAPYYLASADNRWSETLWPHLASWLAPLDPDGRTTAILKFYQGVPPGEPVPWHPWVRPLALWGLFLAALYACMTSLMALMRKQWMDHEHLSYPIAQVPAELCSAAASPWRKPSVLAYKLFWVGFAIPFFVGSLKGLHHYFPFVPEIRTSRWIGGLTPISIPLYLSFAVLGFTFLIPNRVAFSLWFLNIVSFIFRCYLKAYNLEMKESLGIYGAAPYPIMAHQCMGAMLVFIGAGLWFSRRHLGRAVRCALGLGERGYDEGEPCSYRTALALLAGGFAVMVFWIWKSGLSLGYSVTFALVALLIFYGLTRVVAQCGVSVTIAPMIAPTFMASTFGSANISASGLGALTMGWVWCSDIRTSVMGSAAHGMYLARRNARGLLWALLAAALLAAAVSASFTIYLGYRHGAANLHPWFFVDGPRYVCRWMERRIVVSEPPRLDGLAWTAFGALVMAGLVAAQRMLYWWPIHPVGFIICAVTWTDILWASIFLAWFTKWLVVRLGGQALYRQTRRFFLGMILGQFTVAGLWAIIDTLTGSVGNSIFWI